MATPATKLPDAIVTLGDEHRYMNLLLDTLDQQLEKKDLTGTDTFFLMQDIVTYLHDYSNVAHHPTEDLLFEKLVERDPESADDVLRLQSDHEKLTSNTEELLELLKMASVNKTEELNEAIRIAMRAYATALRQHMRIEEAELFPRAVRCLGHSDWRDIQFRLENTQDPLFGQQIGKEYRVLYEYFSDRVDKLAWRLSEGGFMWLDNFILSADALEYGIGDLWQKLQAHAESVADTSRTTVKRTFDGHGLKSALDAQAEFVAFLGRKAFDVGSDSATVTARTLKNMALPFLGDKNRAP